MNTTATMENRALWLAEETSNAYMHDLYGEAAWRQCCRVLLRRGYTEREAEAILRSKIMRWADDSCGHGHGYSTNSAAFVRYLDICERPGPAFGWPSFLEFVRDQLVPETFDD